MYKIVQIHPFVIVALLKPAFFLYFNHFVIVALLIERQKNADREEAERVKKPRSNSRLLRGLDRLVFGRPYTDENANRGGDGDAGAVVGWFHVRIDMSHKHLM